MNTYLLITSIVIFLCILLNRVSNRIGIPALLAFIVLGMLFGSDGIMKIDFDNYAFAEQICYRADFYHVLWWLWHQLAACKGCCR